MAIREQQKPRSTRRARSRIPRFKTIEEAAEFWDTHDTTEFEDEFEVVTHVKFVPGGPTKALTVRLDEGTFAALTQHARELGVRPARLARLWIFEQVRALSKQRARKTQ
jgi:hypothetical protein